MPRNDEQQTQIKSITHYTLFTKYSGLLFLQQKIFPMEHTRSKGPFFFQIFKGGGINSPYIICMNSPIFVYRSLALTRIAFISAFSLTTGM